MATGDPTWHKALEGLIMLALLWFAWCSYAWLGNQAKADEGVLRLALVAAMVCVFLVALAIPSAFGESERDDRRCAAPGRSASSSRAPCT